MSGRSVVRALVLGLLGHGELGGAVAKLAPPGPRSTSPGIAARVFSSPEASARTMRGKTSSASPETAMSMKG